MNITFYKADFAKIESTNLEDDDPVSFKPRKSLGTNRDSVSSSVFTKPSEGYSSSNAMMSRDFDNA